VNNHDIGDRRKLSCEIRDEDGQLADPTEVTFTIVAPDGVLTTYTTDDPQLVRDSVGVYHVYWDCALSGTYRWRYAATGIIGAAQESAFYVRRSKVLPEP
jgi:hypothetical protein